MAGHHQEAPPGEALKIVLVKSPDGEGAEWVALLERAGFRPSVRFVTGEPELMRCLVENPAEIVVADLACRTLQLEQVNSGLKERGLDVPIIVVASATAEAAALQAVATGAVDYLLRDRMERLGTAVRQALAGVRWRREGTEARVAWQECEALFRQVTENVREVFWILDLETDRMLYVSPSYQLIWGQQPAAVMTSQRWLETVCEADAGSVREALAAAKAHGTFDQEYRIVRADGTLRWLHDRAFPVYDQDGNVRRIVGLTGDITDRKRAEEVMRASEERFASFMENLPGMAWIKDAKGRHVFANRQYRNLPLSGKWWPGKTAAELWPKARAAALEEADRQVRESKQPRQRLEKLHLGEEERIILSTDFPLLDERGEVAFLCGIGLDVTEQKRAQEKVREQARMLDSARDAIVVHNIHTREITFWNRAAERLYGWTAQEALGRDLRDLLFAESAASMEPIEAELRETGAWRGEHQHRTKTGELIAVSSHVTLIHDDEGEPKSALVINYDLTEQKSLEARSLRAQRMEAIGRLAGGLAHDLNNILSPILMCSSLLRGPLQPGELDSIAESIQESARRGAELVQQVQTFSEGQEGSPVLLESGRMVREALRVVRETFPKSIRVEENVPAELWAIEADPTQMQQVLVNLCVNARDAMPNGGTLTLRAENLEVDASFASMLPAARAGNYVRLTVSDTGTGMTPETMERIFEPFFTTKATRQGTGLGLSTAHGLVKSHGGFMHVESSPGKGSSFQVYLPGKANMSVAPKPGHERETERELPRGSGELVLVVDDEAGVAAAAQNVLEFHGYRALRAGDGIEALALFAQHQREISVVLTDLSMPHLDGPALIRALRKMGVSAPIIASTGRGERSRITELESLRIDGVLHKPYAAESLLRMLQEAIHPGAKASWRGGRAGNNRAH